MSREAVLPVTLRAPGWGAAVSLSTAGCQAKGEGAPGATGQHSTCLTYFYPQLVGQTLCHTPHPPQKDRTAIPPGASGVGIHRAWPALVVACPPQPFLLLQQKPSGAGVGPQPS